MNTVCSVQNIQTEPFHVERGGKLKSVQLLLVFLKCPILLSALGLIVQDNNRDTVQQTRYRISERRRQQGIRDREEEHVENK
jgi:hypothetical protein